MEKIAFFGIIPTFEEVAMRIIAGSKRGLKLMSPERRVSRPITDRVKESLFSVLYKYDLPDDKIVADIFSGVGSLGLEALSRGAKFVTFVEKDFDIVKTLRKNVEKFGFENCKISAADAFMVGAAVDENKYDLVFVDPPYRLSVETSVDSAVGKLLEKICGQVNAKAIVVVRTQKTIEPLERYGQLRMVERRRWGTMVVTIYEYEGL